MNGSLTPQFLAATVSGWRRVLSAAAALTTAACRAAALGLAAALALSCNFRPLEDPSGEVEVRVRINVRSVLNVTAGIYNSRISVPDISTDVMRVMIYDPVTKRLLSQSFISDKTVDEDGCQVFTGMLNISSGTYDIVAYNFDTPNTLIADEGYEDRALAYTQEISDALKSRYVSTRAGLDDVTIYYEPDHLFVARRTGCRISPHNSLIVIDADALTVVDTYYIQIRATGLSFVSSANAILTGLAPSKLFVLDEMTSDNPSAVYFVMRGSKDDNLASKTDADEEADVICATFNTFGKIPQAHSDLNVTFSAVTSSGDLQQKTVSLDSLFNTEDAQVRHWLLIDEVWEIEDPGGDSGGGGFSPTVDGWEEEHGEITL